MHAQPSILTTTLLAVLVACGDPDGRRSAGTQTGGETASGTTPAAAEEGRPSRNLSEIDPCALLSADDATELLGPLETAPRPDKFYGDQPGCAYKAKSSGRRVAFYLVEPFRYDMLHDQDSEPVSGIGDKAFVKRPFQSVRLIILKGDVALVVDGGKNDLELVKTVATKVLARL